MARSLASQRWPVLIRNARNPAEQTDALRALKNEIVGHALKKEMVVTMGLVEPVVRMSFNKSTSKQDSKAHDHTFASRPLSEEEMVRLQGLQVLGSIALGSWPSLPSSAALCCCPASCTFEPRSVQQSLTTGSSSFTSHIKYSGMCSTIYKHQLHYHKFSGRCALCPPTPCFACSYYFSDLAINYHTMSDIINGIYHRSPLSRGNLATSGVLDALAVKLASFVVAEGFVIPGAEILAHREGLQEYIPAAAPSMANFSVILGAIAVIISDSKFRASQLIYNPSIMAIFPSVPPLEGLVSQNSRAAWNTFNTSSLSARQSQLNAIDYLLPYVPPHQVKSAQATAFPPLGTSGSREHLASNGRNKSSSFMEVMLGESSWDGKFPAESEEDQPQPEEPESPFIAYLILILRRREGLERLMAAHVLAVLYRAGLTSKSRESALATLVVPLLVQMLDEGSHLPRSKDSFTFAEQTAAEWAITERAPSVLALLITDSEHLQKAAFINKAMSKLSKLIKIAYDPVPESATTRHWSPTQKEPVEVFEQSQSSRLGDPGQAALLVHKTKVRESVLKAVAALIPFKEEYRKAVVDHGIVPYIVESLNPQPKKPSPKVSSDKNDRVEKKDDSSEGVIHEGYGANPVGVLIAACGAARALTRSVSTLRTTLVDNGLVTPIFPLLSHPDIEVQIAATATVCNLLMDVSPMKDTLAEYGVIKIICEHAHSNNAKLRLNATWALKHFVNAVSNETKRACLEELGQGWLVQLICDDTEDEALASKSNGNQGNIRSPNEDVDDEMEMDQFEDQAHPPVGGSFSYTSASRPSSSRSKSLQQVEMKLAALRDAETNPARKARKDDLAVQEQGLDLIRNLIGGAGQGSTPECTEMIDYLFDCLGQERVFEILASKLKAKVLNPYSRRSSGASESKIIPPQPEIIVAVVYILVHIAASVPAHRQIVIAQTELLKLLVPHFMNPAPEVRVALCFFVSNLTWMENTNDSAACAQRVRVLKELGILNKIEQLEKDPELDVRERAKPALWQLKAPIVS
ncbi:armadillo repeat protein [Rutstroemia sp. NJR-2017a BBW]|nr:armadillo repeat protein [Rutstroemia sp. NJR-2017a BBW]